MPLPISTLGAIHTIISILAIILAIVALAQRGRLLPYSTLGKVYSVLNIIASVTALALHRHGMYGPAHALAVLTIISIAGAYWVEMARLPASSWLYVQTALMSASILCSFIPAVAETLTRLPVGAPFASSPDDPLIKIGFGIAFAIFALALALQLRFLYRNNRT